mmetsp:Transcript_85226/g.155325  ORF Transcript_85226/g.155325 Transcript_85226/m.155325 type:complete len:536 (-) Transcript_85226:20-1627(-)
MNPVGPVRMAWNTMCLVWIFYDLFMVPMAAFDLEDVKALQVIEWILTIWWTLDMYMTFRTGYIVGSRVEMRPREIAVNYACTWLACDLVIVIVEWVNRCFAAFSSASILRTQRALRFVRILKLVRVVKLSGFWKQLNEQVNSNVILLCVTLLCLTGVLMLTLHIVSCIWYALGKGADDGWPSKDEYEGEKTNFFWYFASVRWTISQFNGRTDVNETRNMTERLFTCLCGVMLAVLAQATFISYLTKALFDLSDVVSEKTRRRRLVNEYLEHNPLSPFLTLQVKRCVNDYQDVDKDIKKETEVLALLPKHLQAEVLECVRAPVLMQHPFFHALPFESHYVMRLISVEIVETISGLKDEMVFDKGEMCERMIFTCNLTASYGEPADPNGGTIGTSGIIRQVHSGSQGAAQYGPSGRDLLENSMRKPIRTVKCGHWVSEAALWVEWRNQGRLVSNAHGIMLAVSASKLAPGLKQQHPDAFSLAYLHGKNVALELNKQHPSELSDILPFEIQLYAPIHVMVTVVSASNLRNADGILTGK